MSPSSASETTPDASFVELDDAHVVVATGADARRWLHDVVTTDVASLEPGQGRPSLLLTPTGRIRAAFHVIALADATFALVQRAPVPRPIDQLLAPYVLSSDVEVAPSDLRVIAVHEAVELDAAALAVDAHASRPSVVGEGVDLLVEEDVTERVRHALEGAGFRRSTPAEIEELRIERGEPRFPADVDVDSLPAEAGWDAAPATDRTKGCFLGQEAVAKIANLGHPTRTILPVRASVELVAGEPVLADDETVGAVTSAARRLGLARVTWSARDRDLRTSSGTTLEIRGRHPVA